MNNQIINEISKDLNIQNKQVEATLNLLSEGNTIPFIARYRKEVTSNLDEEQIRKISEVYEYQVNLLKRKEDVIKLIDEKELLTEELRNQIMIATKLVEVEDLYRPFKEKKKTKATDAIANGLEPLAKKIMTFPKDLVIADFLTETVKTEEEALIGAKYIIAEWISDDANYRKWLRTYIYNNGVFSVTKKKKALDEEHVYEMYYDYKESLKSIKPHRILALNRGEKEDVLSVNISIKDDDILSYLENKVIKDINSICAKYVKEAIGDSYKRLIFPSIERELRTLMKEDSEEVAIDVFSQNVERLLLQPPMKDKIVLGLDPAYRTGCKLAVIDHTGKVLDISVIYPHEPKNEYDKSKKHVLSLIDKYNVDIIAIGNGTASRESEAFAVDVIKDSTRKVSFIIVSEAGASVYSASKLAILEFPDLHVEERSAISIARRLQDPLSELIKIDTKSIGVGEYQHDVSEKRLDESLSFVVTKAVNQVGINVNTASPTLLKYVSGMNKKAIEALIKYRDESGKIASRDLIKKVSGISSKVYEQSIGFMRIIDGTNPIDQTDIHPESYKNVLKLLKEFDLSVNDLGTEKLISKLANINIEELSNKIDVDNYTLTDIINSLKKPNRDPRDEFDKPLLKSDILKIEDLKVGMKLQGTVRNVVDFGIFIDIGLKNDSLAHISRLTNKYIKHPLEVVSIGDIVDCYVVEILTNKNKVSLSLIDPSIKK
ncbi:MAG: Tex family protein [Bacilli bacterium]|nr:Tex family protein [Bacilli bacterium]